MLGIDDPQLQSIRADIHDARSPMRLLALMVWSMRLVFMSSALCEELVWDGDPKRTSGSVLAVATIAY